MSETCSVDKRKFASRCLLKCGVHNEMLLLNLSDHALVVIKTTFAYVQHLNSGLMNKNAGQLRVLCCHTSVLQSLPVPAVSHRVSTCDSFLITAKSPNFFLHLYLTMQQDKKKDVKKVVGQTKELTCAATLDIPNTSASFLAAKMNHKFVGTDLAVLFAGDRTY